MIGHIIGFAVILLFEYILIAMIYKWTEGKPKWRKILRVPLGIIFLPQDWILNILISPVFNDLPASRWEVVTERMVRYKKAYPAWKYNSFTWLEKWRSNAAYFLCKLLSAFVEGNHC